MSFIRQYKLFTIYFWDVNDKPLGHHTVKALTRDQAISIVKNELIGCWHYIDKPNKTTTMTNKDVKRVKSIRSISCFQSKFKRNLLQDLPDTYYMESFAVKEIYELYKTSRKRKW